MVQRYLLALVVIVAGCGFDTSGNVDSPETDRDGGNGGDGGSAPDAAVPPTASCEPLGPAPAGSIVVSTVSQLQGAVNSATSGDVIAVADGTYTLTNALFFDVPNVTLRSESGDRDAVIIEAPTLSALFIKVSDITIADLTVANVEGTNFVSPLTDAENITGTVFYNVRFFDIDGTSIRIRTYKEQSGTSDQPGPDAYSDDGRIECSIFELSASGRAAICPGDPPRFGIEGRQARGWVVSRNRFEGLYCDSTVEKTIEFGARSRDTVIENNLFVNSAAVIQLGAANGQGGSLPYEMRTYPDPIAGCSDPDHWGGIVRNNVIWTDAVVPQFSYGIALWQSCETWVAHNTVVSLGQTTHSIEYRYSNTLAHFVNNLVSLDLAMRDGGILDPGFEASNVTNADLAWFVDSDAGDLQLEAGAAVPPGISLEAGVPAGIADTDFNGQPRDLASPDVGAFHRQ